MPSPTNLPALDPALVSPFDPKRVSAAARRLQRVAEAEGTEASERLLNQWLDRAATSPARTDAAFAAAQRLRDLDVIEPAEAAWVMGQLFDSWEDRYSEDDPVREEQWAVYSLTAPDGPDAKATGSADRAREDLYASWARREAELRAQFHRARGEDALADLMLRNASEYVDLCSEGAMCLVEWKFLPDAGIETEIDPRTVAVVAERLTALAATETFSESIHEWGRLCDAMPSPAVRWTPAATDDRPEPPKYAVPSQMAALKQVRDLGLISPTEFVALLEPMMGMAACSAMDADRESCQLRRALDRIEAEHNLTYAELEAGAVPKWVELNARYERRCDMFMALCLRQYGEHEAATMLIERPEEFHRIQEDAGIGVKRPVDA